MGTLTAMKVKRVNHSVKINFFKLQAISKDSLLAGGEGRMRGKFASGMPIWITGQTTVQSYQTSIFFLIHQIVFSIYMFFSGFISVLCLIIKLSCAHVNTVRLNAQFSYLRASCQENKSIPVGRDGLGPVQHSGVRTAALLRWMFGWGAEQAVPSQHERLLSNTEVCVICQLRNSLNTATAQFVLGRIYYIY